MEELDPTWMSQGLDSEHNWSHLKGLEFIDYTDL